MIHIEEAILDRRVGQPQILVMEDEPSLAQGLQMVLMEEGYSVDLAITGQSALASFRRKVFDLLVADLRLPDIDGMEVIRQVKQRRPETGVIVITGYPSVPTAVKAMKVGAIDYLRKPFTEEEFKAVVEGALKKSQEARSKEALKYFDTNEGKLIEKQEVTRVLNRISEDEDFWRELLERGSGALKEYRLSGRAKYSIVWGDLNWLQKNVGELSEEQLKTLYKRLQREAW